MEGKPNHYDGSVQAEYNLTDTSTESAFVITDEMRKNLAGNPYEIKLND
ncbi:MAG: hypothetical protein Q8906_04575 [Bacillota bacterium]|nr:hypothetical protein [Bacillota bacterium]MDP4169862.1 hypothetical protein [Bacillota bacterium]